MARLPVETSSRNPLLIPTTADACEPVRTSWALADPLLLHYYDTEWGDVVTNESALFERLVLESFQSGLSWLTILRKRPAFRDAFAQFDPAVVAAYDEADVCRLLENTFIVRNEAKIRAAIANAQAVLTLRESAQPFSQLVWAHMPDRTPTPDTESEIPSVSDESAQLASTLKKHGFRFVGPTTMYALMSAVGMVDTHIVSSFRRGCSGLWHADGSRSTLDPFEPG